MTKDCLRRDVLLGLMTAAASPKINMFALIDDNSDAGAGQTNVRSARSILDHVKDPVELASLKSAQDHNDLFDRLIRTGGGTIPWLGFPWRLSRRWIAGHWPQTPGKLLFEPAPNGQDVVIYSGPLPNPKLAERWGLFEPESGWVIASTKPLTSVWVSSMVPQPNMFVTQWRGKSDFTVRDIHGRNMGAHRTTAVEENYDRVVLNKNATTDNETCSRKFSIIRCGNSFSEIFSELRDGGISILYSRDGKVVGGSCTRGNHGVMLWGGDSRTDGLGQGHDWNNQRKCLRISVVGFQSYDVHGAFCWASMADDCEFVNCTGKLAGDVGFDWEGSIQCTARGCTAWDAKNGNYACFFHCDKIIFKDCSSFVTNANYPLFRIYTESNDSTQNRSITINGGVWTSFDPDIPGTIDTSYGCCRDFTIENIVTNNCTITTAYNNMFNTRISNNKINFTIGFPAFSAIRVGFSRSLVEGGSVRYGTTVVVDNIIESSIEQASVSEDRAYGIAREFGSVGIDVIHTDPDNNSATRIEKNKIGNGFLTPLLFRNWSPNQSRRPVVRVYNNKLGVHSDGEFRPIFVTADGVGPYPPSVEARDNAFFDNTFGDLPKISDK